MTAIAATIAILLALAALGWDPAIALMREPAHNRGVRADGAAAKNGAPFVFAPIFLPPSLLLVLMLLAAGAVITASAALALPALLLASLPVMAVVRAAALAIARWWYARRVRAQLLGAVQGLASQMEGDRTMLVTAFALVTPMLAEPLRGEWSWALAHLNLAYTVTRPDGVRERRTSSHADVLERLAAQTPVRLHAQALSQLAAIYEQQMEAHAHERLVQLAASLARHATLQRSVTTLLGRIRGEAYVISGAFAGVLAWLAWSQPARVWAAFAVSEWGALAALWFGLWLVLPIAIALLIVRIPELPL